MKKHKLSLESDLKSGDISEIHKKMKQKENCVYGLEMVNIYGNAMMYQVRYPAPSSCSNSYLQTPPQTPAPSPTFGNSSPPPFPPASYGSGGERQSYVHKQYPNTLYRPGLR